MDEVLLEAPDEPDDPEELDPDELDPDELDPDELDPDEPDLAGLPEEPPAARESLR